MQRSTDTNVKPSLVTLPGDDVRQILWRYAERYDLAMLVQSVRQVARGPVARLVANGARNSHDWTEQKASLLAAFDESGITAAFLDPQYGGFLEGPKNLALALIAFELSWVDAGAATSSLASNLGLEPIHECGTPEQKEFYMSKCVPKPGEKPWRAAFALTEPLPFVGVETSMLSGKMRVSDWKDGEEPMLQVDKRGRFITGMGFANVVTLAVDSDDKRIKGSCMIIVEEGDPGVFDRGTPTKKLVHQLSSTADPVFSLKVPASRIVGGYTIKDGVIIPRYSHGEVIEAVFRHTRVTVGLMTSAKLLSSVEPVIRYQRSRFRGGEGAGPGSPRYDLGLQQKEDVLHRLIDIWATGESSSSLGFATARMFDELDPLHQQKEKIFAERKIEGGRAQLKAMAKVQADAIEYVKKNGSSQPGPDADPLLRYALLDSQALVMCPACKLWNTGYGATMMREAVSLMGGYGITEDCPGFLGHKWMDSQLEATYEGPEAVQRRQLSVTMTNALFLTQFKSWIADMRRIASEKPGTGACTLATAMQLWVWTLEHLQNSKDADGTKLFNGPRQGVTFAMADALCWLLAARCQVLDLLELEIKGKENPALAEGLAGTVNFLSDLCHVQMARAAGEVRRVCAELVYGYNQHPAWDQGGCEGCFGPDDLDLFDAESKPKLKAGPCVSCKGLEPFVRLSSKLDGCLTGCRLAKDRAAEALTKVMIPEALDYPV